MKKMTAVLCCMFLMLSQTPGMADQAEEIKLQIQALQQQLNEHQQEMLARQKADQEKLLQLSNSIEQLYGAMGMESDSPKVASLNDQKSNTDNSELVMASATQSTSEESPNELNRGLLDFFQHNWNRASERDAALLSQTDVYERETPSGRYGDPASFFFLHGYSTVTYADFQNQFGTAPGETSQILVAGSSARTGKHESGFKNDTALFIGSELSNNLKGVFEVHFVGNGRDPVITESKMTWEPFETEEGRPTLKLTGGRYWWPFGIHSEEWFSALNNFSLLSPAAAEVLPAHFNELGVMAEGEWAVNDQFGLNYLVSVGNGVNTFELSDNVGGSLDNTFDQDSNRTVTTRVGIFPGIENLSFGLSYANGNLRNNVNTSYVATDARRYQSDFHAYGVDATYVYKKLDLRGYWYASEESLEGGAALESLDRNGGTLDILYNIADDAPVFKDVNLKLRASTVKDATLADGSFRRSQYAFGVNARPHEHFLLKAEYYIQTEDNITSIDNNGFVLSSTVEF